MPTEADYHAYVNRDKTKGAGMNTELVTEAVRSLQREVHSTAVGKGWWDDDRSVAECVALIHSEVSEFLEMFRTNQNTPDEHLPELRNVEVEAGDIIIRVLDLAGRLKLDVGRAIVAKAEFNKTRPRKHGKNF